MFKRLFYLLILLTCPVVIQSLCMANVKATETTVNEEQKTAEGTVEANNKSDFLKRPLIKIPSLNLKARPVSEQAAITASVTNYRKNGEADVILAGNNRLLYPYGLTEPVMSCAVLRVCSIELEQGEVILGKPYLGDTMRWWIGFSKSGNDGNMTAHLIVKPLVNESIETNMIITTDRRVYNIVLKSVTEGNYTPTIGFYYPQEAKEISEPVARKQMSYPDKPSVKKTVSIEDLNFNYFIQGKKRSWYPERVYDDGSKTFIQLPLRARNYETPVFFIVGDDGKYELANYRMKTTDEGNLYYVVDRLFERGVLVLSKEGKSEQRVHIVKMRDQL